MMPYPDGGGGAYMDNSPFMEAIGLVASGRFSAEEAAHGLLQELHIPNAVLSAAAAVPAWEGGKYLVKKLLDRERRMKTGASPSPPGGSMGRLIQQGGMIQ